MGRAICFSYFCYSTLVVQGCYTLLIAGKRIPIKAGEEYLIPRGVCATAGRYWREQGQSMYSVGIGLIGSGSHDSGRRQSGHRSRSRA